MKTVPPVEPLSEALRILEGATAKPAAVPRPAKDLADAERVLTHMASLVQDRDRREAALNSAITKLKEKDEPAIQKLNEEISAWETILEHWAEEERKAKRQFVEKKSIGFFCGEIGFRENPLKVNFLKGWTEGKILAALNKFRALKKKYVKTEDSLKKTPILNDFKEAKLDNETAKKFGIEISREESFFCETTATQSATTP
jgi:phage host-nuclease inhibitor protein Gam